jgi:glucokinase
VIKLNNAMPVIGGVKAVIGPGTGLGQCYLTKSAFAPYYEVNSAEGGHSEFAPRNEEEFALMNFAKKYIETSMNVDNEKGKPTNNHKLSRISIERVCAGPAVPLLYQFFSDQRDVDPEHITLSLNGVHFN